MTTAGSSGRCRECGLELPPQSAHGHCPHCLLGLALNPSEGTDEAAVPSRPARRIFGGHELLEEIATGGMGVVWKARQLGLNRIVALKTLHAGGLASASARLRFRIEVEAVARLSHPNIVSLYETGESEGVHFYTMTLVEGGDLARLLADPERRPSLHGRIELMAKIARAVEYAHQRGILHRDLKPSNVLIDARGEPLIADFGLARPFLIDAEVTLTGTILGSPHYMAPEQARGDSSLLSTAVDLYSLGAMLYEAVAGRPPFVADTPLQVLELARTAEPMPPCSAGPLAERLTRAAARDLDTVVLKCLRKEPGERFTSARDLAEELERWLDGRPIFARPVPALERAWRWCRREPALAGALGVASLLFLALAGGAAVYGWRMDQARRRISTQATQLAARNTDLRLREASARFAQDQSASAVATLAGLVRADPSNSVAATRLVSALRLRSFGRPAFYPIEHPRPVTAAQIQTGTRPRLLTVAEDGLVRWWDPDSGNVAEEPFRVGPGDSPVTLAPNGARLVAADANRVVLWDLTTRTPVARFTEAARVVLVRFGMDGSVFVTVTDRGEIRCRSVSTGLAVGEAIHAGSPLAEVLECGGPVRRIVGVTTAGAVRIWDSVGGQLRWTRGPDSGEPPRVAMSPDATRLVIANDDKVQEFGLADGRELGPAISLPGRAESLQFSPDGAILAASVSGPAGQGVALVRHAASGRTSLILRHRQEVRAMEFSRDGRRLLTASGDGTARLWNTADGRPEGEPLVHSTGVNLARFGADEREIVTGCFGGMVWLWHLAAPPASPTLSFGEPVVAAVFDPSGERVAAGGLHGQVRLWNPGGTGTVERLPPHAGRIWHLEFGSDGRWLASAGGDGLARVRDLATGIGHDLPHENQTWVMSAHFDARAERLVTAGHDRRAVIWDFRTGTRLRELLHPEGVNDAVFSPDGQLVLTRSKDDRVRLWDAATGRLLTDAVRHTSWVDAAVFGPEGQRVFTASRDTTLSVWDPGETLRRSAAPDRVANVRAAAPLLAMSLNGPGTRLVVVRADQTVELRSAERLASGPELVHQHPVFMAEFDRTGSRVITAAGIEGARIWDAASGHPLSESLTASGMVFVARFHPNGQSVLTAGEDGVVRLWPAEPVTAPAPPWLADLAETTVVLREDSAGGFTQLGVKTWPELERIWGARAEFKARR